MRLLTLALAASTTLLAQGPAGIPGHIKIELKTSKGWLELYQPDYALQQAQRSFKVPAAMAPKGVLSLRFTAPDNDETQIDYVGLKGGSLLSAKDAGNGADFRSKLNKLDRDVAEIRGREILVDLKAPQGAEELTLQLAARSSNNASLSRTPFNIAASGLKGAHRGTMGPIHLAAKDGAHVQIDTGKLSSASGHPDAPILGNLRVEEGRLKGQLDFGLDNDPGNDDYASVLVYDAKGQPKEFKVTPLDQRFGKATWAYGDAAKWQYMRFNFDLPLASLPRSVDGDLALSLLAYGTCGAGAGPNADYYASSVAASSVAVGNPMTINLGYAVLSGGSAASTTVSATVIVMDPFGLTVSTQVLNSFHNGGNCSFTPALSFNYTPNCSGTFYLAATIVGTVNDPNPNNAPAQSSVVVTGGSACVASSPTNTATSTATPTPTNTGTATPSGTPTFTHTPQSSHTVTSTFTITPTSTSCGGPCPTDTVTPANSPTPNPLLTATAVVVGVSSAKRGEPMLILFPSLPVSSAIEVYNLAGDRVATVGSSNSNPIWATDRAAAGIYFLKIKATLTDGSTVDVWKKAMLSPN